jgi:hypothetical protein
MQRQRWPEQCRLAPGHHTASACLPGCRPQVLEQMCLEGCRQLFCTVSMSGASVVRHAGLFDVALVDEAAQLVEAESLILLHAHPGLAKLVLVRGLTRGARLQ